MTFEQFQASAVYTTDLARDLPNSQSEGPGRMYLCALHIEHWIDDRFGKAPPSGPTWLLSIGNLQWQGPLEYLERLLFEFAVDEGYDLDEIEPEFSPAGRMGEAELAALQDMANAAMPTSDDDWGSDRQIDAENDFHNAVVEAFGFPDHQAFSENLSHYITSTKMTSQEAIEWTMSRVADAIHNIAPAD